MSNQHQSRAVRGKTVIRAIYLLSLFVIPPLLWAGNFIVGKAVRDDISPVTLTFTRWLVALIVILPFALPHIRRDAAKYREVAGWIVAVSVSGVAAFSLLVYIGLHHTSGTNALLLNSCMPVLILLFGAIFFGHHLSLIQAVGLLISCCGVLTIIFKGDVHGLLQLQFSSGDLILLAAMACFALYTLWLRKIPADINRIGLLGVQTIVTLIVICPLLLWQITAAGVDNWNKTTVTAVLFLGIFPSFISYLFYGRCIEEIGAARAGLSIHLIPVFGVALSLIFLGESLHLFHVVGILTILAGVALAGSIRIKHKNG
ncbi:DMT family transporter [Pectobacterium actinidiae]|uniref:DMT family transporter n=1 Tax=Pectobacterium actinidiae TaxID=1507808 RepID=UPI00404082FD